MGLFRSLTNTVRTVAALSADACTMGMMAPTDGGLFVQRSLRAQKQEQADEDLERAVQLLGDFIEKTRR